MFKKLKDKITEEVNQASLRLPSTVQQLSQYSPFNRDGLQDGNGKEGSGLSFSSNKQPLVDLSDGNPQFSLAEEDEGSPQKQPQQQPFQTVDLSDKEVMPRTNRGSLSRHSSISSVISEPPLFSYYEPASAAYNFQSDLESTASEFEDSSPDLTLISKEQLFAVCQKTRARYHKYKGRYSDLAKHYRELEREKEKIKTILTESQDKALRRIAELREQCQLEQQAKAHLEENLRSDLEEKDSLIKVLNTKISWLKEGKKVDDEKEVAEEKLIDIQEETPPAPENPEVVGLKARVSELEGLLHKCKEHIKNQKERSLTIQKEKQDLETRLNELEASNAKQLSDLTESLNAARVEIETLRKQEQETALGIAQTQQRLAGELEAKEGQVQKLWGQIKDLESERSQLRSQVTDLEAGLDKLKTERVDFEANVEEERQKVCQEMSRGKMEALRLLQEDMDKKFNELEEEKNRLKQQTEEAKRLESEAQRALRLKDEEHHKVLTELHEESKVALEAQNMDFNAKLAQQEAELRSLQSDLKESQQKLEKLKEELLSERQNWVRQIEDNRVRHLQELETLRGNIQEQSDSREQLEKKLLELQTVLDEKEAMVREFAQNGEVETIRQKQLEGLEKRVSDLVEDRDDLQKNLLETERLVAEKDAAIAQLPTSDAYHALESKLAAINSEKAQLSELLNQTIEKHKIQATEWDKETEDMRTQLKNLQLECEGSQTRLFEKEDQLQAVQMSLEEKVHALEELNAKLNVVEKAIEEKSSQIVTFEQKLVQSEAQFGALQGQLQNTEAECQRLSEENGTEKRRVKALEEELQTTLANLEEKRGELLAKERDLGADMEELAVSKRMVLDLQSRVEVQLTESEKYLARVQQLETELSQAQQLNEALNAAKAELELSLEEARANETQSSERSTSLEQSVAQLQTDLERLRESEAQLLNQCQTTKGELENEQGLVKRLETQMQDLLGAEEARSRLECKLDTYETDLQQLRTWKTELEERLKTELEVHTELEMRLAEKDETLKNVVSLQTEMTVLSDSKADLEQRLELLQQELRQAQKELKQAEDANREAATLKQELSQAESNLKSVQGDIAALRSELDTSKSQNASLTTQLEGKAQQCSELESSLRGLEKQCADLNEELTGNKIEVSQLQQRVSELEQDLSQAKDKNVQLDKDLSHKTSALQTSQKNCETLKRGLREKNKIDEKAKKMESQLQVSLAEKQALVERSAELEKVLAEEKDKAEAGAQELLRLKAQLEAKEKSVAHMAELERELREAQTKVSHTEEQLKQSREAVSSLESALREKEGELQALSDSQNADNKSCKELEERCLQLQQDLSDVHTDKSKLETLCKKMKAQMLELRKTAEEKERVGDTQVKEVEEKCNKELEGLKERYERETADLRQIIDVRNKYSPLEEATELEYLRNILYEYMMGRQPTVLAKVIAAVVKFTNEQTLAVVSREEQRQSLLGQLGFV